ncbi:MAG: glutamine amidotransferase [Pirellulales bacterium]
MNSQWYFNPVGGYGLAGGIALGLILLFTLLGLPRHRLSPRRRWILMLLRLGVIALAMFAMLRPALVYTKSKPQSATLVVLADRSRSMMIADAVGGKSRFDMLRAAVDEATPTLAAIAEDFEVKLYAFDSDLHALRFSGGRLDLGDAPDGQQTAIGAALEDVLRREAGKRLVGVILLSDGAQRAYAPRDVAPQGPTRRLADLGYPLYTFPFGQARGLGQARDVALADLSVNQAVYVKNELTVRGTARIEGFGNQAVPVQLLFEETAGKMKPVAGQELKTAESGQSVPIELSTIPQTPGEYKVTLRVPNQSGELVTTNNEMSTFVTVLKGGINVLYLEGALRVDQIYLRRSLDASPDIKVDFVRLDPRDPSARPVDLADRFAPGKYDVYMIGDVDSSQLTAEELQALANVVGAGAGLVMLGGFHTFGPGGYADTPLVGLVPVEMDARERQRPGDPIRSDVQLAGPIKVQPTEPVGRRHYLMALGENAEATWARLPPLEGANRLGRPKPAAQVLAETSEGRPLLVVQEAGGRVMAFAGDTTWHWWMEGFAPEHKRFWRQVILWSARKDELSDGTVWIKLAERRFSRGQRVAFEAGARSPEGESLAEARFTAVVTLPDGSTQKVNLVRQGDRVAGSFDEAQAAGDYAIAVTAEGQEGAALGSAGSRFLVFEQDLELDNAVADPTLLASLSAITKQAGGQSFAPEELSQLLGRIQQQPKEMEIETQVKLTPWDTWPFFGLFIVLISVEWYLRKKWGLV